MNPIVFHPSRIGSVIISLIAGDLNSLVTNVIQSLGDFYYRPTYDWGPFNILFTHTAAFIFIYIALACFLKFSNTFKENSPAFKFLIYFITLPPIVLLITLFLPSV